MLQFTQSHFESPLVQVLVELENKVLIQLILIGICQIPALCLKAAAVRDVQRKCAQLPLFHVGLSSGQELILHRSHSSQLKVKHIADGV